MSLKGDIRQLLPQLNRLRLLLISGYPLKVGTFAKGALYPAAGDNPISILAVQETFGERLSPTLRIGQIILFRKVRGPIAMSPSLSCSDHVRR
jgi:hypothetical protein